MARSNFPNKSERLTKILKFLAFRARSEAEIRDRLTKYHTPEAEVKLILDKLHLWHLVDDVSFAQQYIESRSRSRPRSRRLLGLELRRKGVTSNYELPTSDFELAKVALSQKKSIKSRDQAIRFLQSRGFSWEIIAKVLKLDHDFG